MIGAIVMIVAGGLVVVVGVLGWLGRLPRNRWAGVCTSATMRSDRAFAAANRAAGPTMILGGLAAIAGGSLGLVLPEPKLAASVLVGAFALGAFVVIGAVQGIRAADNAER